MNPSSNEQLDAVGRLRDAINAHDPRAVAACFTADYRCEHPMRPSQGFVGSDRVLRNWTAVLVRFPHFRAEVLRTAVGGAEIWSEWEHVGKDAAGNETVFRGVVVLTLRGRLIDWTRFYLEPVTEDDA